MTLDTNNLIEIITFSNLSTLTLPTPTLIIPAGFATFYVTTIQNNFNAPLGLPTDIQQLVKSLIDTNQVDIE